MFGSVTQDSELVERLYNGNDLSTRLREMIKQKFRRWLVSDLKASSTQCLAKLSPLKRFRSPGCYFDPSTHCKRFCISRLCFLTAIINMENECAIVMIKNNYWSTYESLQLKHLLQVCVFLGRRKLILGYFFNFADWRIKKNCWIQHSWRLN